MASSVMDEKVVKLSLDSDEFSDNAAEAIKQLQILDGQSVDDINTNLEGLASTFSTLGVIGITVLTNLTNKFVDFAVDLAKTLSIDQLTAGFSQYEQKLQSTLTLQTALGKDANDIIQENLAELEAYANLTTYSIGDMQKALAGFVNAGVDIDLAAVAIQGMGNVSASAGVSVSRFASVMETAVTQSMSMGYMSYENWRQLQDAGVATARLKEELLATYTTMTGEELDSSTAFTTALTQQQWLTNDILNTTLARLAVDEELLSAAQDFITFNQVQEATIEAVKTGWSDVFETLFGGLDEARELWTPVGNAAIAAVQAPLLIIENIAQGFRDLGGTDALIEGLGNSFSNIVDILKAVRSGLEQAFPVDVAQILFDMADGLLKFSEETKPTEEQLQNISDTIEDVGGRIYEFIQSMSELGGEFTTFIRNSEGVQNLLDSIKEALSKLNMKDAAEDTEDASNSFSLLSKAIEIGAGIISGYADILGGVITLVGSGVSVLGTIFSTAVEWGGKLLSVVSPVLDLVLEFVSTITLNDILTGVIFVEVIKFLETLTTSVDTVTNSVKSFSDLMKTAGDIGTSIKSVFDSTTEGIKTLTASVKANTLSKYAVSIAVISAALFVLSKLEGEEIQSGLTGLAGALLIIAGALKLFETIKSVQATTSLIAVAAAAVIMAAALKVVASIDTENLLSSVIALAAITGILVSAVLLLSLNEGKFLSASIGMVAISASMVVLATSLKLLSTMSVGDLTKSVVALTAIMALMVAFTKVAGDVGISDGVAIGLIAGSIVTMSLALMGLSLIDTEKLIAGVAAISGLLLAIGVTTLLIDDKKVLTTSVAIGIISASIVVLAAAVAGLSMLDSDSLTTGLVAFAVILGAVAAAVLLLDGSSAMMAAISMTIMAGAMVILTASIKALSSIGMEEMATALFGLVGALTALVVLSTVAGSNIAGAIGITIMASAAVVLAVALTALSVIDMNSMATALIGLAAGIGVLALLGYALGSVAQYILLGALAIAALGVSLIALGAGMASVATGVAAFITGMSNISVSIDIFKDALLAFLDIYPVFMSGLLIIMQGVIQIFVQLFIDLLILIADNGYALLGALFTLLINIIKAIGDFGPELLTEVVNTIGKLVLTISNLIPTVVAIGVLMIAQLIQGMSDTIMDNNDMMVAVVKNFVIALIDTALAVFQGLLSEIPFVGGMIDDAIGGIRDALENSYDPNATKANAEEAMEGMASGLTSGGSLATSAATAVTDKVESQFQNGVSVSSAGYSVTTSFVNSIKSAAYSSSTSTTLSSALSKIRSYFPFSPAKEGPFSGKGWVSYSGKSIMEGMAEGIADGTPTTVKAANKAMSATSDAVKSLADNVDSVLDLQPVITPTLDTKNLRGYSLGGGSLSLSSKSIPTFNTPSPNIGGTSVGNTYAITINSNAGNAEEVAKEVERVIVNKIEHDPTMTMKIVKNMTKMTNSRAKVAGAY